MKKRQFAETLVLRIGKVEIFKISACYTLGRHQVSRQLHHEGGVGDGNAGSCRYDLWPTEEEALGLRWCPVTPVILWSPWILLQLTPQVARREWDLGLSESASESRNLKPRSKPLNLTCHMSPGTGDPPSRKLSRFSVMGFLVIVSQTIAQ